MLDPVVTLSVSIAAYEKERATPTAANLITDIDSDSYLAPEVSLASNYARPNPDRLSWP